MILPVIADKIVEEGGHQGGIATRFDRNPPGSQSAYGPGPAGINYNNGDAPVFRFFDPGRHLAAEAGVKGIVAPENYNSGVNQVARVHTAHICSEDIGLGKGGRSIAVITQCSGGTPPEGQEAGGQGGIVCAFCPGRHRRWTDPAGSCSPAPP